MNFLTLSKNDTLNLVLFSYDEKCHYLLNALKIKATRLKDLSLRLYDLLLYQSIVKESK